VPDLQGSVIGTMSNAGTLTSFAYKAYGASVSAPAQFGYTGQRVDAETGYYYYRTRQYWPGWGRFPQPDPIGYGDGTHLYAYVGNDPLNLFDPFGLDKEQSSWWNRAFNFFAAAAAETLQMQQAQTAAEMEFAGSPGKYAALQFAPFAAVAGMAVPALGAGAAVEGTGAAVATEDIAMQFGGNSNAIFHAFRHIDAAGIDRAVVQAAIRADLQTTASQVVSGQALNVTIPVGNGTVTYTAFRLTNGVINVGRIVVP